MFMYAPLFSSYSQKLLALKATRVDFAVEILLGQALDGLNVNPHNSYLNILESSSSAEFARSITLFEEALACVEESPARPTRKVSARFSASATPSPMKIGSRR
jgi:hypothetical protein